MSDVLKGYNELVKLDKEPDIICCHAHNVGSIIKELYHEHIPITRIMIDDRYPNKILFLQGLGDIPEDAKKYYAHYTVTLPPEIAYWKEKGLI